MEHRCTDRIASELKILIYKHNRPVAIGRVKNGSRSGVFVETDFVDVDCEHHIKLEILLNKTNSAKLQRIEMNAIVIHKTPRGFGAEVDFQNAAHADMFIEMLGGVQVSVPDEQMFGMVANS
jgi:hypothetical protein